jgi:hypothetical protein
MRVVVHADLTGLAPSDCQYSAVDDDTYEPGCPIGFGATPEEAIADLQDQLEAD